MQKKIGLREYQPSDRGDCIAIFESNVPDYFDQTEQVDYEQFLNQIPGPYFILQNDNKETLGCGGYEVDQNTQTAFLRWGMIDARQHGGGLGSTLFQQRIAKIKQDPFVKTIHINTSQKAEGFYQRFGFVTKKITHDYFGPGLHRCDMLYELDDR